MTVRPRSAYAAGTTICNKPSALPNLSATVETLTPSIRLRSRYGFMASFQSRNSSDFLPPAEILFHHLAALPGLKEIVTLRQVHALEHATVWVLSEMMARSHAPHRSQARSAPPDNAQLSGLSTHEGFYVYGQVATPMLCRAVRQALQRVVQGEPQLAIHPRCGTNVAVGLTLTLGLTWGAHVLLPKHLIVQAMGIGTALAFANQLTPEVGAWAQQHLTTALPWNLIVRRIYPLPQTGASQPGHFVQVMWHQRESPS